MGDHNQQAQNDEIITGEVEFCENQGGTDPWQSMFELCLDFSRIARERADAATAASA